VERRAPYSVVGWPNTRRARARGAPQSGSGWHNGEVIPLRTTTRPAIPPVVTRALLALNCVVFIAQLFSGSYGEVLVRVFGFTPHRFLIPEDYGLNRLDVLPTLFTSLVLHGGFVHLAGNMLYLWIFGSGVEGKLGHGRFLALYVACGVAGSLLHMSLYPQSRVPSIGASGCIAGTLGAFLVLWPRERIITLIPFIISWTLMEIPALVLLPLWFGLQFLNGFLALASAQHTQEAAAVAWWAHIGGFAFGAVLAAVLRKKVSIAKDAATTPGA
jgi:rhomboid family protein